MVNFLEDFAYYSLILNNKCKCTFMKKARKMKSQQILFEEWQNLVKLTLRVPVARSGWKILHCSCLDFGYNKRSESICECDFFSRVFSWFYFRENPSGCCTLNFTLLKGWEMRCEVILPRNEMCMKIYRKLIFQYSVYVPFCLYLF